MPVPGKIMTTEQLISINRKIVEESIDWVQKKVLSLSDNQLNWRPNPGIWSVHEVLAHLNSYASYYYDVFDQKIEKTKFRNSKEEFSSSPLGRSAWKSMKLGRANNVKRKFKAPKVHNPGLDPELMHDNDAERFIEWQNKLLSTLDRAGEVNLKKVKIPISISKMVRLRLGDALLYVSFHVERHIQQIKNLQNSPNFPKK